jgi:CheY-like chemotaxis protein
MDKETLGQIFEPFFTTKGLTEGTGMGLSTVHGIVKQNQGTVDVHSEPGLGTTFEIYLPRCVEETVWVAGEVPAIVLRRGTETLLLVEDEKKIVELAKFMLEGRGYTVLAADTTEEALRLAGEYAGVIHLLITDVVMPMMSGLELAERVHSLRPETKCLYMSAYTVDILAGRGVIDSGVHFLQKPFSGRMLAEKVREVLES